MNTNPNTHIHSDNLRHEIQHGISHPVSITTPGMQGFSQLPPQLSNQNIFHPSVRPAIGPLQGGTSYTPTLAPKFPSVPIGSHSLTPQLTSKHHIAPPQLTNQMLGLSISNQIQPLGTNQNAAFPAQPLYRTPSPQTNQIPSFSPQTNLTPSLPHQTNPIPSFSHQTHPIPSFSPQTHPIPSFSPQTNPIPSFSPQTNQIPSFSPQTHPIPSFSPQTSPIPSLPPQTNLIPSFSPQTNPIPSLQASNTFQSQNTVAMFPPLNPPVSSKQPILFNQPPQPIGMQAPTSYQQTPIPSNQPTLANQTPVSNPIGTQPPMGFNNPPTNQPMGFNNPPTSQPMGFNNPPTSQPMGFNNPPTSQPMGFNNPPTSQPMGFNNPPTNQPMGFNNPPTNQPMGFNNPPTSQPMGFNNPPTSQPMGFNNPPTNQPMGFNNPPTNQPMGFNNPPTSQPMGFNNPPTSQPMGFNNPPTNQPMGFNNPPTNQPMGSNQFPPTNQPMGFNNPPTNQPMGSNQFPPTSQPMGFNNPPTNQPMGSNQFPPQLIGPGQQAPMGTEMGQFGAPPVTSQPKVTPDSIPSVVEVLAIEKERWVSNEYLTGSRTPPPGALVSCPIRDTGNCSPRFIRSSLYTLPVSAEMIKESKLVAGLIIQPLANDPDNQQLPLVDHGPGGPIRCKRCKAYMNPFNCFLGGGASYSCIFCGVTNEVPSSYFQHCDAAGKRMDAADRPELSFGSYELSVTRDYMRYQREGDPPAIVLVIDISMRSYNTGLEGFLSSHISDLLGRLPENSGSGDCTIEVGLVLYDTQAYYFNLSAPLPLIYVVTEPNEPFLPEPAGSLVPVPQAINSIKGVLERFPSLFPQRKSAGSLGVGVRAGLSLLSEMKRVGKLIVFQTDIPEIHGPGQIKRRTDNFFTPQSQFYDKISVECQRAGVSVDLFLLPSSYTDVFTLGQLCHFTGGQLHYHYNFSASKPACYSRLLLDLQETMGTEMGFDAVMRIRTSPGLSPDQYQGAIRLSGTEIQLAGCDANKTVAVVLRYEDKLKENSLAYIQVALLYTNLKGERRLRLHNLALCTSSLFEHVYLSADLDTLVQLLARLNLRGFLEEPMEVVSDRIRQQVAHILATYRRHCNPGVNKGQLILPATMKLLPCYSNCILKLPLTPLHTSLPNSPDMRAYSFYRLQWLSTREFLLQLYPMVYPLDPDLSSLPDPIRASLVRIEEQRAYLATDGQQVVLWVGNGLQMNIVAQVFGVSSVHQVDPSLSTLPKLDNDTSRHIHDTINHLNSLTGKRLSLSLSKQGDQSEHLFRGLLVEDGTTGNTSYVDSTCLLHREIKKLLS